MYLFLRHYENIDKTIILQFLTNYNFSRFVGVKHKVQ